MPSGDAKSVANDTTMPPSTHDQARTLVKTDRRMEDERWMRAAMIPHSRIRKGAYTPKYKAVTDSEEIEPSATAATTPNSSPSSQRRAPYLTAFQGDVRVGDSR